MIYLCTKNYDMIDKIKNHIDYYNNKRIQNH